MITLNQHQTEQVCGGAAGCEYGSSTYDSGAVIQIDGGLYQICVYDPSHDPMYYWAVYTPTC
jgi:hypothetical protein